MRWILAAGGLALAVLPGTAMAKDEPGDHLRSVVACGSVIGDQERLLCFDRTLLTVRQALEQGRLVVQESKGPRALAGVVKASGARGDNRYWVELDNGDRWLLLPTTNRGEPPRAGASLKLRKNLLSSGYWISGDGWKESRADYLGKAD